MPRPPLVSPTGGEPPKRSPLDLAQELLEHARVAAERTALIAAAQVLLREATAAAKPTDPGAASPTAVRRRA